MRFLLYENCLSRLAIARLLLVAALLVAIVAPLQPTVAQQPAAAPSPTPAQAAAPQTEDGWVAIKLDEGILFVWNVRGLYFTLTIKGKQIKPLNDPEHIFFSVDDKIFQIQLASISEFARDAKEKKLEDKAILAAHRDWESAFVSELLKSKLDVRSFNTRLSNGSDALMWQFDMPEGKNADAKAQVYLTVVSKDYVLLLNCVATATVSDEIARTFLLDTIGTLKISAAPIDVKKISDSIRAGTKP